MRICLSCREPIDGGAVVSEGNFYHPEHFCCHRCRQPIGEGFHSYKMWRLCDSCFPRPVCHSNNCSHQDRRIGQKSGTFYRLPTGDRLEAFHSSHTLRCCVCGRGIFCAGAPASESLAYHLNDGRPNCTRCYYHLNQFGRWQRLPDTTADSKSAAGTKRFQPPLPDEMAPLAQAEQQQQAQQQTQLAQQLANPPSQDKQIDSLPLPAQTRSDQKNRPDKQKKRDQKKQDKKMGEQKIPAKSARSKTAPATARQKTPDKKPPAKKAQPSQKKTPAGQKQARSASQPERPKPSAPSGGSKPRAAAKQPKTPKQSKPKSQKSSKPKGRKGKR
ncbi:hypothetical protein BOX15_Mlig002814g1 [Macrostomum lignano]|uniref:Uncharacterized protein n=2 Tax=Macrostomum lignano TaxID=282301 RepID=A0A267H990_9PLAT|nr:hypothetical protein BOX15_Mlig034471g1 [Macrostomum lignano]PAA94119.1 hypothetical protein BOX15_Mlig002814g1 [Macrostomum lignano]